MQDPKERTETTEFTGQEQAGELTAEDLGKISGGMYGIAALIAVSQAKTNTSNQDAL
jgi:hypothetical protein